MARLSACVLLVATVAVPQARANAPAGGSGQWPQHERAQSPAAATATDSGGGGQWLQIMQ